MILLEILWNLSQPDAKEQVEALAQQLRERSYPWFEPDIDWSLSSFRIFWEED